MISIAIINLKGGVGKSVTACNLAAELAALSKSVLVVDLDKQGNTSKFFGVLDYDRPSVAEVMMGECRVWDAVVEDTGVIGVHGCSEEYMNGANQYGKKASADLQAYNSLIKNYNTVTERLGKLLPPEKRMSKLEMLDRE